MSVPPLKSYLSPESTTDDNDSQQPLSPRRRTVSRFHADYEIDAAHPPHKSPSLSPSFAADPLAATGTSKAGSTMIPNNSVNFLNIGESFAEEGSPLPRNAAERSIGNRSASSLRHNPSLSAASPYSSPSAKETMMPSKSPIQALFAQENERSLSKAAMRILTEEEKQLQHENQIATHIELALEEQRRKEQERKERREAAKKAKEAAKATKVELQTQKETKSGDVITLSALDNDEATKESPILDGGALSFPKTTQQPEIALYSSISSQSEEVSDLDRTTINSTPHSSNHAQPHDNATMRPSTWSDTVSIASDVVVGSDTMVPPRPSSGHGGAPPPYTAQVNTGTTTKKNESFWDGLFKKDKEKKSEVQKGNSSRFVTSQPESSSNFSRTTDAASSDVANNKSQVTHIEPVPSAISNASTTTPHKNAPKPELMISTSNPAIQLQPLSMSLRARVVLVGEQGSGKTSFKACFTSSVLKSLPEVSQSMMSSNSTFYFKADSTNRQKHRQLDVTVVDSGPLPLTAGVTNFYGNGTLYIMTLSLAGVKQKAPPKSLNPFGPKQVAEPIIFEGDRRLIKSHLQTIASIAPKNSAFVLIGTFMDVLSDSSQAAVEAIIVALRKVVLDELANECYNIMFRGCFAISCVDHKVISDLRPTGPKYISDLWAMLCETMMKDALSNRGGVVLQTPASFGWNTEMLAHAQNSLEEKGEHMVHSTTPQLGNIAHTLLAKFVSESTRLPEKSDNDPSLNATLNSSVNTATPLSSRRGGSIHSSAYTTAITSSPQQNAASHNPFSWLLNLAADPTVIIENAIPFTEKMLKQTYEFEPVEKHCIRIRHTNASIQGAHDSLVFNSGSGSEVNPLDEDFAKPCRGSSIACSATSPETHDDPTDRPQTYRELIGRVENPFSPISLLSHDDELAQLMILRSSYKAQLFIQRAKQELNFVVTPLHALRQHFYAIGVTSNVHFNTILDSFTRDGDIAVFRGQPFGRDDTVLFQPHLISRAIFALVRSTQLSSYPVADRKKLIPYLDAEEVHQADPNQVFATTGMISDLLLVAFSGCMSQVRKSKKEASDLLQYLLISSDFMLSCRESAQIESTNRSASIGTAAVNASDADDRDENPATTTLATGIVNYFSSKTPKKSKIDLLFETPCSFMGQGWRFVAPSLVKKTISLKSMQLLQHISIQLSTRERGQPTPFVLHRQHVSISPYPPYFRFKVICRLSRFIQNPNCVFRNGVWLSNPQLGSRCLLSFGEIDKGEKLSIAGESVDAICISQGSRIGAIEFLTEIFSEIRSMVKQDFAGSLITVEKQSMPTTVNEGSDRTAFDRWAQTPINQRLQVLDEVISVQNAPNL